MDGVLTLKQLCLAHRTLDVSIRVEELVVSPARPLVILGENGSGKSLLLSALSGKLAEPWRISAEIELDSKRLSLDELFRMTALVPQHPNAALNPSRRVEAQLLEALRRTRASSKREAYRHCVELLQATGCNVAEEVLEALPHELSLGVRRQVSLVLAIITNPSLLLADEPTYGLDPISGGQVCELLRRPRNERPPVLIAATADARVCTELGGTVTVLYRGHALESASGTRWLTQALHPYSHSLLDAERNPFIDRQAAARPTGSEAGCIYADQCALRPRRDPDDQRCRQQRPALHRPANDHWVRCHFVDANHEFDGAN